jgi:ferredoxin
MVFLLPSDGPTRVIDETPNVEFAEIVREAEALCPTKAIRVED